MSLVFCAGAVPEFRPDQFFRGEGFLHETGISTAKKHLDNVKFFREPESVCRRVAS